MERKGEHKTRWDLVPFEELDKIAQCFTRGTDKYDDDAWKTREGATEGYFAAAMRHITAFRNGEIVDEGTRLPHLTCAITDLMMVNWHTNGDR